MKTILKRSINSFIISAICGAIAMLLIELIVTKVTGMKEFRPISPEFMSMFPSETIAVEVNILLYGIIGAGFAAASVIYEQDKIGFVLQNLLYYLATSVVWVPIVMSIWQLGNNIKALTGTLAGFALSYIIMTVVGYKIAKRDIKEINLFIGAE